MILQATGFLPKNGYTASTLHGSVYMRKQKPISSYPNRHAKYAYSIFS